MIQVFKTDEEYVKWLDGQTLPSGIVVYVSDDETMYFSTNNIKGELKTYKCEKEEPIQYPPLIYSAKSAGSTITVNGQSVTLEQGDNITLEYPTAITSVKATNNTALTYIQIPNTVTSIESLAFNSCPYLASVNIPDTVTSIGDSAFARTSLTSITIPDGVTSIESNAFEGCTALTDFKFNGTKAQWGAITLGTDWKNNAAFTVVHCTDGDVSLEEPIQPIQPNNLVYSTNAAGSTITVNGETVTLGQGDNITLDYPNEITSVTATDNTALTYIQIPNTVVSIGNYALQGCTSLTSINIPEGVTSIGKYALQDCTSLTSITIPDSVTRIDNYALQGCTSLTSITIPNSVTSIRNSVLSRCTSLTSITIPDSIIRIDNYALESCTSLTSITIPNSVTLIGSNTFSNCSKLTDFNYNGTTSQWASITLGTDWKYNTPFTVVHCTDGDVTV